MSRQRQRASSSLSASMTTRIEPSRAKNRTGDGTRRRTSTTPTATWLCIRSAAILGMAEQLHGLRLVPGLFSHDSGAEDNVVAANDFPSDQLTDGGLFRSCGKDRGELVERGDRIAQGGRHLVLGLGLDLRPVIDEEIALENLQRALHRGDRLLVLLDVILARALVPVEHAREHVVGALRLAPDPRAEPGGALDRACLLGDRGLAPGDIVANRLLDQGADIDPGQLLLGMNKKPELLRDDLDRAAVELVGLGL